MIARIARKSPRVRKGSLICGGVFVTIQLGLSCICWLRRCRVYEKYAWEGVEISVNDCVQNEVGEWNDHRQWAWTRPSQVPQDVVLHHARRPAAASLDRARSYDVFGQPQVVCAARQSQETRYCTLSLSVTKIYPRLEKLLDPSGSRLMPLPHLQIYLRPHVTLNFDLLTSKVDSCMIVPHGPPLPIHIEIGSFAFKISYSQYRLNEWLDGQMDK